MSCPTNWVTASWPWTWFTRNWSLMCILLKSPVRSCTVTSAMRPTIFVGSSERVSPMSWRLNISGARRLYQTLDFHLSLIFLAAARVFFSAMRAARKGGGYLRVPGEAHDHDPVPGGPGLENARMRGEERVERVRGHDDVRCGMDLRADRGPAFEHEGVLEPAHGVAVPQLEGERRIARDAEPPFRDGGE